MNSHADLAIHASGLVKSFGGVRAVNGIDLSVPTGTVYGLLGPNGAGKTTAVRMLATVIPPDAGNARVFGHDIVDGAAAIRRRMSLTGQMASVDDELTGFENLVLLGRLLGHTRTSAKSRARELLEWFELTDAAQRLVKTYSGGMRRRLDLAAGIIVTPDLVFLDEPTTGLDPRTRNQVWEIVRTLVSEGTTVLLTTQYLDEADQLADRIAVIDHGRVIAEGTTGELKASVGSGVLHLRLLDPAQRLKAEQVLTGALGLSVAPVSDPRGTAARLPSDVTVGGAGDRLSQVLAELSRSGVTVTEFAFGQPSLDEVFLSLTGRTVDEAAGGEAGDGEAGDEEDAA